eukprot:m.199245 g.199245  ORF g.199245 m.199245 type:complete len:70 (-) comp15312_c0_seq6:1448-1657(-)
MSSKTTTTTITTGSTTTTTTTTTVKRSSGAANAQPPANRIVAPMDKEDITAEVCVFPESPSTLCHRLNV